VFSSLAGKNKFHRQINSIGEGPSTGFRIKGAKTTPGVTFLNTILDVCSNRGTKHEMGGTDYKWGVGHHWSPCWRRFWWGWLL